MRVRAVILAGAGVLAAGYAPAAPQPSVAPTSWELDFRYHDPDRITLALPGDTEESTFWYVLYTVTNTTGREVGFYPTFHIVTNKMEVVESGYGISPSVAEAILVRHHKVYPFSVDPMKMYGPLLQGEDNARTSVMVFPPLDAEVSAFTVYVGGLSGEVVKTRNLKFDPRRPETDENPRFFYLRKTLAIHYGIAGDANTRMVAAPVRVKQEWVMR